MSEEKKNTKFDQTCKMSFLFGFFAGMALLSVIIFIGAFVLIMGNYKTSAAEGNTSDKVAQGNIDNADVQVPEIPNDEPPAQPVIPIKDGEYVKGNKDAKVEIIEYSDFECPYCLRHNKTMDTIFEEYKDKAKFVFRHFPLSFHPEAQKAAEASECAGDQGKFWEMHDAIFEANEAGVMSIEKWKENAKNLGLDMAKFNDCLDSGAKAEKIAKDMAEAQLTGVSGTPGTFINGSLIKGAYPYEAVKAEIEQALQQ